MTNKYNSIQKIINGQKMKLSVFFAFMITFIVVSFAFANTPIEYNIVPEVKENSIIDTKAQKKLNFSVVDKSESIFYDDKKVSVSNNTISVDVSRLAGIKEITFYDEAGNNVSFNYYFSNKSGKVEGYELVPGKVTNTYISTVKGIKIIYTDKEKSAFNKLKSNINKMPKNMLVNLKEIKMIPFSNTSNIAGTTKDNSITLYNFSKYTSNTQKNIIYHEIAHTWANKLMDKKIIDYSYSDYSEVVKKDDNFVSNYAKDFANDHQGKLSEDFADAVAFYIINQSKFKKSYPNRTAYIKQLLNAKL